MLKQGRRVQCRAGEWSKALGSAFQGANRAFTGLFHCFSGVYRAQGHKIKHAFACLGDRGRGQGGRGCLAPVWGAWHPCTDFYLETQRPTCFLAGVTDSGNTARCRRWREKHRWSYNRAVRERRAKQRELKNQDKSMSYMEKENVLHGVQEA